ncbi:MAG: conjugal transfer protein TraD [Proteobacteria bacterium]|nr:conjugal transfer protein TraD [Pseudomonadota bacterium]
MQPSQLLANLVATQRALRRAAAHKHRLEAQRARHDTRDWVVKRRERTRHLIELGGLVKKSGLVELTNDDRAAIYGGFLELAFALQAETRAQTLTLWRRRGSRAFKDDKAVSGDGSL